MTEGIPGVVDRVPLRGGARDAHPKAAVRKRVRRAIVGVSSGTPSGARVFSSRTLGHDCDRGCPGFLGWGEARHHARSAGARAVRGAWLACPARSLVWAARFTMPRKGPREEGQSRTREVHLPRGQDPKAPCVQTSARTARQGSAYPWSCSWIDGSIAEASKRRAVSRPWVKAPGNEA